MIPNSKADSVGGIFHRSSTRERLLKGFGASALGQVINVVSRVALVPLFLHAWGTQIYGEWLLLTSVAAYLSLTDFGSQVYVVNQLTQAAAKNDLDLFQKTLHTGLALFLLLPAVALILFLVFVTAVPPQAYLNIVLTRHEVVLWVVVFLALQVAVSLPQGILLGVYRSLGMLPRGTMWANATALLQLVLTAAGLWLGGGMILLAVLQVAPYLIVGLIVLHELRRLFPQHDITSLKQADIRLGLSFIPPSLRFFSIQLSQSLAIQGTLLVVGALQGAAQVVLFATLRTIANVSKQLLGLVSHTAWPEMTRLDAVNDWEKVMVLFRGMLRTTVVVSFVFVIVFHYLGQTIYEFWLARKVAYDQRIMDLFLLYVFQAAFWTCGSHLLMAVNRHKMLSRGLLFSALLTVGLGYVGTVRFGLEGMVGAMILADVLLPLWYIPVLLNRYCPRLTPLFFLTELLPVIAGFAALMLFSWSAPIVLIALGVWWFRCLPQGFLKRSAS